MRLLILNIIIFITISVNATPTETAPAYDIGPMADSPGPKAASPEAKAASPDPKAASPASASTSLPCNGSPDWCRLRFDQYTFPATHNSAAVDLKLDCASMNGTFGTFCPVLGFLLPSVADCFLNNHPGHPIDRQLQDGIRAFDMDTCQVENRAVLCHGQESFRGLGKEIPVALDQIRDFLEKNPREIVSLEFGDALGNPTVMGGYIKAQMEAKLGKFLVEHPNRNAPWPTLGEMIQTNKRVVTFYGKVLKGFDPRPGWALNRYDYFMSTWFSTNKARDPKEVVRLIKHYCDNPNPKYRHLWQAMDFEYSVNFEAAKNAMARLRFDHSVCIDSVSKLINSIAYIAVEHCSSKGIFIHRLRVDRYWESLNLIGLTNRLNSENVKKFAKGN